MPRLAYLYIGTGLIWVVATMCFGIWVGVSGQFHFSNSHAHMGLLGFVVSVLFGLIHNACPDLGRSRFALVQFALYEAGAALLIAGKAVIDAGGGESVVKIGAIVILAGTLGMLGLFATLARPAGRLARPEPV